jgi:hypothetical protein
MRRPHTLVIQVSKIPYLFMVSCEFKYATYIANQLYKSLWRGGNSLSRRHFIPETTSPVRVVIKNKNKADHSTLIVNSKPLLFSRQKYCCTLSAYLTSSLQIEVAQDQQKKPFRHLCSLCITSNNVHITIRQAREQGCPADL